MGIDARWEDEQGDAIEAILEPQSHLTRFVNSAELTKTVCLRFLDPYGDTTFNQLQLPLLVAELTEALRTQTDPARRMHLAMVLELASKARGQVHTYLRFIGD